MLNAGDGDTTRIRISPAYNNTTGAPITANSVFTFDPSPFYNANENPLIGRISTITSNLDTLATKNIGEQVDFTTSSLVTSEDFFPIKLAVYETKPVTSNLDIYWETSTSGLISELNQEIVSGDTTTGYGYSDPSISWFEDEGGNAFVSGAIFPVNASGGNVVDPNAVFTLDSTTFPAQNDQATPNWLQLVNNGDGSFTIKTTTSGAMELLYYGQSELLGYNTIRATITTVINFQAFTSFIDINLSNIIPSFTSNTFYWTNGPRYPVGWVGNQPAYMGSLMAYGFYSGTPNNPWPGINHAGITAGNVTNGIPIPNSLGQETRELMVSNVVGTLTDVYNNEGADPPTIITPGNGINVVTALAGDGSISSYDLSHTGLGFTIDHIPSNQSFGAGGTTIAASFTYQVTFTLTDGGGLYQNYSVTFVLNTIN